MYEVYFDVSEVHSERVGEAKGNAELREMIKRHFWDNALISATYTVVNRINGAKIDVEL